MLKTFWLIEQIQHRQILNYTSLQVDMGLDEDTRAHLLVRAVLAWAVSIRFDTATSAGDVKHGRAWARAWQTILFTHISVLNQSLTGSVPTKGDYEFD